MLESRIETNKGQHKDVCKIFKFNWLHKQLIEINLQWFDMKCQVEEPEDDLEDSEVDIKDNNENKVKY